MTANSYTGFINTNRLYETIASVASFSFTSGKKYVIQVRGSAEIKIANAEFEVRNEKFEYDAGDDTIYIKTDGVGCTLTILEG